LLTNITYPFVYKPIPLKKTGTPCGVPVFKLTCSLVGR
jgi:hypothetical protein